MRFKKGQSGNPRGRPVMPKEVREAIRNNGEMAVMRMSYLLMDDSAFGPKGWIKPREQILLLATTQERAFGRAHNIEVDHHHGGSISLKAKHARFQDVLEKIAGQLPERKSQRAVLDQTVPDADVVEILPPNASRR